MTVEKGVIKEMIDLRQEPCVVVDQDEENERDDHGHVEDHRGLRATGLDLRREETVHEQPHQGAQKNKVKDKEPEGQKIEHRSAAGRTPLCGIKSLTVTTSQDMKGRKEGQAIVMAIVEILVLDLVQVLDLVPDIWCR